ncbi:hypothetical protein NMG60_11031631 [Bertholletia excelsa]
MGIWGMGGIGKTTIAEFVYNQISWQFKDSCYLENVKEVWREKGAKALQQQLLGNLSGGKDIYFSRSSDGLHMIKKMTHHRKILIALDDVDCSVKIEKLIGNPESFGKGSRIIITTRDKHLLTQYDAKQYEVELLNNVEALQLFGLKAFGKNQQIRGFQELVSQAIAYAGGLPLALEVLGSSLRGKEESVWKSTLDKLKQYPEEEVQSILKLSYDALQETEKRIFLDIACCLKNMDKERVVKILDSCDFYASSGVSVLEDKSLISISHGRICMHQLVQEMGWNIVKKESKNPAERTRLWDLEDLRCVLIENKGTKATESIAVEVEKREILQLGVEVFSGMTRLRLLKIGNLLLKSFNIFQPTAWQLGNVQFAKEFEYLPSTLRYLDFDNYPSKQLPSMFQPMHLVELNMRKSNLERLWEQTVNVHLPMLRVMDLSGSRRLTECPDFTASPHLERLNLYSCTSLRDIHPSIGVLRKLTHLDIMNCRKLTSCPDIFENMKCLTYLDLSNTNITEIPKSFGHLTGLEELSLFACPNVTSIPDCFENMKCLKKLDLSSAGMAELPASIFYLTALEKLYLSQCENLRRLPKGIGALKDLEELDLSFCEKLDKLPEDVDDVGSSVMLSMWGTAIREVPLLDYVNSNGDVYLEGCRHIEPDSLGSCFRRYSFCSPGEKRRDITTLNLTGCHLRSIPPEICLLHSLVSLHLCLNDFEYLPGSMVQLSNLQELKLSDCDRLQQLPELSSSLRILEADNCKSLRTICNPLIYTRTVHFSFLNCYQLVESNLLSERLILNLFPVSNLLIADWKFRKCTTPGCEIPKWFSHQSRMGSSISFQLPLDCCNDNFLGILVCFVFEAASGLHYSMEIKGGGERRFEELGGFNYKHKTSNELGARDNVCLVAIKCDANLTNGREIKVDPKYLRNIKVKKCGAHLLYRNDPIFSSIKSNDRERNNNDKKIPSSGNCDEDFITLKIRSYRLFIENKMVDRWAGARTHPLDLEHTKYRGGKDRNCQDQLDINHNKDLCDHGGSANFEEEQNTKRPRLSYETLELDIDLNKNVGDHSESANFVEEQSTKRPRLLHETLELDIDLNKDVGDHSESANFEEEQSTKRPGLSHETLDLDLTL